MFKITTESHVDHALSQAQVDYLLDLFKEKEGFFIETVTLPPALGTVPCNLHGPVMGDRPVSESEVEYRLRGVRTYPSRMVPWKPRQVSQVTVIAGPLKDLPCVWYTAFGGPLAPKEPGDPTLTPEQREESESFWKEHALSL